MVNFSFPIESLSSFLSSPISYSLVEFNSYPSGFVLVKGTFKTLKIKSWKDSQTVFSLESASGI